MTTDQARTGKEGTMTLNERIRQAKRWTIGGDDVEGTHYYLSPEGEPADPPDWEHTDAALDLMREMAVTGCLLHALADGRWACGFAGPEGVDRRKDKSPWKAICRAWLAWKGVRI